MTAAAERVGALERLGAERCDECKQLAGSLHQMSRVSNLAHLHVDCVRVCDGCEGQILADNHRILVENGRLLRRREDWEDCT